MKEITSQDWKDWPRPEDYQAPKMEDMYPPAFEGKGKQDVQIDIQNPMMEVKHKLGDLGSIARQDRALRADARLSDLLIEARQAYEAVINHMNDHYHWRI